MLDGRTTWTVRLLAFSLALGGLRDQRLFAIAGAAAWWAVWLEKPPLGPAAAWLPWLGWAVLSTIISAQPLAGLPVIARWAAVLACASLAASWNPRGREEWLKSFLVVAAGLAAAALVTGARAHFRNEMTGLIPPYYNYTAFALSAAAAASAAWILHPRGARGDERKLAAAVFVLALVCIVLARSRGALLGLAAASAVWAARRWGRRAALIIAGAALIAGISRPPVVDDMLFKKYRLHAEARPLIWSAAAAVAADRPVLGTGPGSFASGFRLHPAPFTDGAARWSMSTDYAHSEPLQAAAETGWAGLILWLLGAGTALRALFARANDDPVREAAAAAGAAMTAQLAVDNMLQIPALAALWLSALAIASARAGGRRWPKAAVLAGGCLALISWIPKTLAAVSPAYAAAVFPAEPRHHEDLAYAAMAAGRGAEAEAQWEAARRLEPFNAIYPWRLAQLAGARGRWDRAESMAARAIELEQGFLAARLLRAEVLLKTGRTREARKELDEILRLKASREAIPPGSGYDRTVAEFDPREHERISVAVLRSDRRHAR